MHVRLIPTKHDDGAIKRAKSNLNMSWRSNEEDLFHPKLSWRLGEQNIIFRQMVSGRASGAQYIPRMLKDDKEMIIKFQSAFLFIQEVKLSKE